VNELHEAVVAAFRDFVSDEANYVHLCEWSGGWRLTLDGHLGISADLAEKLLAYLEANAA
jgi:hypothetical protein